jgi:hypothetical protein
MIMEKIKYKSARALIAIESFKERGKIILSQLIKKDAYNAGELLEFNLDYCNLDYFTKLKKRLSDKIIVKPIEGDIMKSSLNIEKGEQ